MAVLAMLSRSMAPYRALVKAGTAAGTVADTAADTVVIILVRHRAFVSSSQTEQHGATKICWLVRKT